MDDETREYMLGLEEAYFAMKKRIRLMKKKIRLLEELVSQSEEIIGKQEALLEGGVVEILEINLEPSLN